MIHNGEAALGDDLRKARELRGIAIERICELTKVPAKHIRALEAGNLSEIPGGVFRRGFVRSYVGALGLDEVRWMKRFDEVCRESGLAGGTDADWVQFAENVKNARPPGSSGRAVRGTGIALLLIALLATVWCGWRLWKHKKVLPLRWHRSRQAPRTNAAAGHFQPLFSSIECTDVCLQVRFARSGGVALSAIHSRR